MTVERLNGEAVVVRQKVESFFVGLFRRRRLVVDTILTGTRDVALLSSTHKTFFTITAAPGRTVAKSLV